MSSKEQFKDALKKEKQIIVDLKKEIQSKDLIIREQKDQIAVLKVRIDLKKKLWYQFWK
jgi:hypothetical protein